MIILQLAGLQLTALQLTVLRMKVWLMLFVGTGLAGGRAHF